MGALEPLREHPSGCACYELVTPLDKDTRACIKEGLRVFLNFPQTILYLFPLRCVPYWEGKKRTEAYLLGPSPSQRPKGAFYLLAHEEAITKAITKAVTKAITKARVVEDVNVVEIVIVVFAGDV